MGIERIKWRIAGFRELRKSSEVTADLIRRAQRIAAGAGSGYSASVSLGKNRGRASVFTKDAAAMRDNAKNNTLIRNLDRGR
jgi:hypothetical protein